MKDEFWTLFYYRGFETICSKHSTLPAAERMARAAAVPPL